MVEEMGLLSRSFVVDLFYYRGVKSSEGIGFELNKAGVIIGICNGIEFLVLFGFIVPVSANEFLTNAIGEYNSVTMSIESRQPRF